MASSAPHSPTLSPQQRLLAAMWASAAAWRVPRLLQVFSAASRVLFSNSFSYMFGASRAALAIACGRAGGYGHVSSSFCSRQTGAMPAFGAASDAD